MELKAAWEKQKAFFSTNQTKPIAYRLQQLKNLKKLILDHEKDIMTALFQDLKKPEIEAYTGEVGYLLHEIDYTLKNLKRWAKGHVLKTPPINMPGKTYIFPEPYGTVLIISPWNYPFQLLLAPLVGSIAAGNCSILKPSEIAPHTSALVASLIPQYFAPEFISVVEGGVAETKELLSFAFDFIFYTGNSTVARVVMEAASKNLTPVALELGGKNPCIVTEKSDLKVTAREIAWGKFFNAGQTCIAPDYLLVPQSIEQKLTDLLVQTIQEFYGEDPQKSKDYGRIINQRHFKRVSELLQDGKVVAGGKTEEKDLYISPTLLTAVASDARIMKEEIFGPVLPIIAYNNLEDALSIIKQYPKPLVVYMFSKDKKEQTQIAQETSSGGICFNATLSYLVGSSLPFGGVGESGMGKYHGQSSFALFSHPKSILRRSFALRPKIAYPPYSIPLSYMKKLLNYILG
ncbi:MAG: aldehyde dehydrogenase family protein [Candidatus Brocadiae bacterium]|nr:aldehyde dehydrogenase family protein [Candidatus Brocadiia bacterium]